MEGCLESPLPSGQAGLSGDLGTSVGGSRVAAKSRARRNRAMLVVGPRLIGGMGCALVVLVA